MQKVGPHVPRGTVVRIGPDRAVGGDGMILITAGGSAPMWDHPSAKPQAEHKNVGIHKLLFFFTIELV